MQDWADGTSKYGPPISIKDLGDEEMLQQLIQVLERKYAAVLVASALPAENLEGEKLERGNKTFDVILND